MLINLVVLSITASTCVCAGSLLVVGKTKKDVMNSQRTGYRRTRVSSMFMMLVASIQCELATLFGNANRVVESGKRRILCSEPFRSVDETSAEEAAPFTHLNIRTEKPIPCPLSLRGAASMEKILMPSGCVCVCV